MSLNYRIKLLLLLKLTFLSIFIPDQRLVWLSAQRSKPQGPIQTLPSPPFPHIQTITKSNDFFSQLCSLTYLPLSSLK